MLRGDRLKNLRESNGFTHEKLAGLIEVSVPQIWRYEAGRIDPSAEIVSRMAKVFDVTADYLLGLTSEPTRPGLSESDLTEKERAILSALRRGENYEAIKVIVAEG